METTNIFNIKRFGLLLRNDLFRHYRTLLIGAGTVAAVYFVIILIPMIFANDCVDREFNEWFFPTTLLICGFLLSAASFKDIHLAQKNTAFFMLPASRLEKLSSRILLTSIIYLLISILFYFILNMISVLLAELIGCGLFPVLNPFSKEIMTILGIYLISQSIFIFGSIYFKSHAFMKTGLSLFALFNAVGLFAMLVFRIVFNDFFDHSFFMHDFMVSDFFFLKDFSKTLLSVLKYLVIFCLAPYFWIVSYIRLGEKEV